MESKYTNEQVIHHPNQITSPNQLKEGEIYVTFFGKEKGQPFRLKKLSDESFMADIGNWPVTLDLTNFGVISDFRGWHKHNYIIPVDNALDIAILEGRETEKAFYDAINDVRKPFEMDVVDILLARR
jgi:hypothetical protein